MSENTAPEIHCPKCNSTQLFAGKKGFSGKKAVAGAVLTGGVGLLAGTIGSNKVKITCLACGHVFNPGDKAKEARPAAPPPSAGANAFAIFILIAIVIFIVYKCG